MHNQESAKDSVLLLSREMSHFLLRLQLGTRVDAPMARTKMLQFGRPLIAPFIIFDRLLIDPTVGSFVDAIHPRLQERDIFKSLKAAGALEMLSPVKFDYQDTVLQATKFTEHILRDPRYRFPEALQPDYLLETPLYLFFKESEPFVQLVTRSLRSTTNISLAEIAFVFSACYSAALGAKLGLPVLTSRPGASILSCVNKLKGSETTLEHKVFRVMSKHLPIQTSFEVPDFCTEADSETALQSLIARVIDLRNDARARLLRQKIQELVSLFRPEVGESAVLDRAREEVTAAAQALFQSTLLNRNPTWRKLLVKIVVTAPFLMLGHAGELLGHFAGESAEIAMDEVGRRRLEARYGWVYFLFENGPFTRLSLFDDNSVSDPG